MRTTPRPLFTRLLTILAALSMATVAACSSPEERAQSHYQRGAEYLQAGDNTSALLEFRNAVKLDETLASAWYGIATIEEANQNWPAVLKGLQSVIELDASHVEARKKAAKLHLASGDIQKALELVNAANALKADDSEIHAIRAGVLLRLNDREAARADAERALSLDRDNVDAYAVLAADALQDENSTSAMRFVDRGLEADPQNPAMLMFKLKIHGDSKDYQSAESVLRQLIVAVPDNKNARRMLVALLVERGRRDDAEIEMRAAVAADPTDIAAALELVEFVGSAKGPQAARQELDRLIEDNPGIVDYKLAMARFDYSQSQPDAAIERINEIIARGEPSEDVQQAKVLLAEIKVQEKDVETASALVAEILAEDAKDVDALTLRAHLSLQAGEYVSATADLREALNQQPESVKLLQLLAKVFERQGVIDLADDQYVQAVRASNYAPSVVIGYANFLAGRGDMARAEAILSESLSRRPDNARVLSALGRIRLRQQDWVGAQDVAELLKKLGDQSGFSDQILGVSLLGQEKFDQSIDTLKNAYSAAPEAARPLYAVVSAYVRSGKTEEAETFVNSVLAASPDNADAHVLRGALHAQESEPDKAIASYRTAIERQPKKAVGYRALAAHLLATQKVDEAEAVLRSGREQVPDDFSLELAYAGLLEQKTDFNGALAVYEGLLESRPDALILVNNIASLLADHTSDEASLERAHQLALRLADIDVPAFKDTLGWVLYRRGDFEAALRELEAAVEGLPKHPLARYHLALTYQALGRHEDAKAELAEAAKLAGEGAPLAEKIQEALKTPATPRTVN